MNALHFMKQQASSLIFLIIFVVIILWYYGVYIANDNSLLNRSISQPASQRSKSFRPTNKRYDLTIWSSDFHISPINDVKNLLSRYGVRFIDKSLSSHCHFTNSCAKDLDVINRDNGINLGNCPNQLMKEFYDRYIHDDEFQSADIILCTHACSMCELFMPFNKTLIVIASTR